MSRRHQFVCLLTALVLVGSGVFIFRSPSEGDTSTEAVADAQIVYRDVPQTGHVSDLYYAAFTPDGRWLVTLSADGEILLWDARGACQVRTIGQAGANHRMTRLSPDGRTLLYSEIRNGRFVFHLQPLHADQPQHSIKVNSNDNLRWRSVCFSEDSRYLLIPGDGNEPFLCLWDVHTGKRVRSVNVPRPEESEVTALTTAASERPGNRAPYDAADYIGYLRAMKTIRPDGKPLRLHDQSYPNRDRGGRFCDHGRLFVSRNWYDTGSNTEEVCVWDVDSGRLLHRFEGPWVARRLVELAPDGTRFLVGIGEKTAELRSAETGDVVQSLRPHNEAITEMAFSHSGRLAITGTEGGQLTLWDLSSGRPVSSASTGHHITSIDIRHDDQRVVVTGRSKHPAVYSLDELELICRVTSWSSSAVFSPDGSRVLLGVPFGGTMGGRPRFASLHAATGKRLCTVTYFPRTAVVLSADGMWALGKPRFIERWEKPLSPPARFYLWNVSTGERVHSFPYDSCRFTDNIPPSAARARDIQRTPLHTSANVERPGQPFRIRRTFRFTPSVAETIATIPGLDDGAREWLDSLIDRPVPEAPLEGPQLMRKGRHGYTKTVWNLGAPGNRVIAQYESGEAIHEYATPDMIPTAAILNSDSSRLIVGCRDEQRTRAEIMLFDTATGRRLETIDASESASGRRGISGLALSPDNRFLAVDFGYQAAIYDRTAKAFFDVSRTDGGLSSKVFVNFSPDSRRAVFFGAGFSRTLWSLDDPAEPRRLTDLGDLNGGPQPIFSPDGQTLYWKNSNNRQALLDASTGELKHEFSRNWIKLLFNADGTRLVPLQSNTDDIALWDFNAGTKLCDLADGHGRQIADAFFTPDGTRLVTLRYPGQLTLRDAATGYVLHTHSDDDFPFEPSGNVPAPFFMNDGQQFVTIHRHAATIWNSVTGEPDHRLPAPGGTRCIVVRSPDGMALLTAAPGNNATLWNCATGSRTQSFGPLPADVSEVAFSPDGSRLIVSYRRRQAVCVWDVGTGEQIARHQLTNASLSWHTAR